MAVSFENVNAAVVGAFGTTVTHQPAGGASQSITAILEQPAQLEADFPDSYVVLFALVADFTTAPAAGDVVIADGKRYNVIDVLEDAAGGVRLRLHRDD